MRSIFTLILFLAGFLFDKNINAQNIQGHVVDSLGKPVPFATVNLKTKDNVLLNYVICGEKGDFKISISDQTQQEITWIEASSIGYQSQNLIYNKTAVNYNFRLLPDAHMLRNVNIKDTKTKVVRKGDTVKYNVSEFTEPQDRVIGDVLKKLPGIEIDDNGKISYNGKAISHLYIGGDDLLDDKYNIATNTIPANVVDQVHIMENHQPIKMLRGKVYSDDVALNLTIKKEASLQLIGQAQLGAGLPGNYDENVNAMLFKSKYKAIDYVKGNNTGYDVASDLISQNATQYAARTDNNKPVDILSLGTAGNPDLIPHRYLFNQAGLVSGNNLVHLNDDWQAKVNFSYLHDTQSQTYQKTTQYFLPTDTITYTEGQLNHLHPDLLNMQLNLNANADHYYINNSFVATLNYNSAFSALNTNGTGISQNYYNDIYDFSNELAYLSSIKNGPIIGFYSYIDHISEPEQLLISPASSTGLFNATQTGSQAEQLVNIPTWVANNYLSIKLAEGKITQQYKLGINIQKQQLQSDLNIIGPGLSSHKAIDSASNSLGWLREKFYAEAGFDVPGKKLRLSFNLPATIQFTRYQDGTYMLNQSLSKFYTNPQILMRYQTGTESYVGLNYTTKHDIGTITDVYRGYILNNYRSLFSNDAGLTTLVTQKAGIEFGYSRAVELFFIGLNGSFSRIDANNISSSIITDNFQKRTVLPYNNSTDNITAASTVSKYVFLLHTTLSGSFIYSKVQSNQFQNNTFLPFENKIERVNFSLNTKIAHAVTVNYKLNFLHTTSSSPVASGTAFNETVQNGELNYSPLNVLNLSLLGDDYLTRQALTNNPDYFFLDFRSRYRFIKKKLDVEIDGLNLLNVKTYTSAYVQANTFTSSQYTIPGRIVMLKITFNY